MEPTIPPKILQLREIFAKLDHVPGLKLQGLAEEIPEKSADFLFKFLTEWNKKYPTIRPDGTQLTDTGTPYQKFGRSRSPEECYDIISSYYSGSPGGYSPDQFFADIYEVGRMFHEHETFWHLFAWYCSTIKRQIFSVSRLNPGAVKLASGPSVAVFLPPQKIYPFYLFPNSNYLYGYPIPTWKFLSEPEIIEFYCGEKYGKRAEPVAAVAA